ncbi:MAG: DUF6350 family protein [Actinomycetota bacterium]
MAVRRAAVAFVVVAAAAEAVIILLVVASSDPKPGPGVVAGSGAVLFHAFHHVPLVFDIPRSLFPPAEASLLSSVPRFTVSWTPLAGTGLALWMLGRGGRAVGTASLGTALSRGLHGTKIAIPYALASFALAFAAPVTVAAGGSPGVAVHPDPFGALLWPLGLGVVAGFSGGVASAPADTGRSHRLLTGAVTGAWWTLGLGLALSFAGLLVIAAVHPQDTRTYLSGVSSEGTFRAVVLLGSTALVVPNAAAWILVPAMGGCTGLGELLSSCLLSYSSYAGGGIDLGGPPFPSNPIVVPPPPAGFLLFLVVPLAATTVGGTISARRSRPDGPGEGAAAGALGGVGFGLLCAALIVMSQLVVRVGKGGSEAFREGALIVGPDLVSGIVVALAWGVSGGTLGGLLWARRAAARSTRASAVGGAGPAPPP